MLSRPFRISAVLFDFDGTLTVPGALDFVAVRRAVGCPSRQGLLEFLAGIEDAADRRAREEILEAMEIAAAEQTRENAGATQLVQALHRLGVPLGIITRNTSASVERALARLPGIARDHFRVVVTRDLPIEPKPLPEGVHYAAERLGVAVSELLVVGDYAFDIAAGRSAGALTMYLHNDPEEPFHGAGADFVVHSLTEALNVIRQGLPLPVGKLPSDLLQQALAAVTVSDPAVLVGARIGEDAAVMDIRTDEVLVLASDPVTLAADAMAHYAVHVNANDVATTGATPRWFLATLLFPPGTTASEIVALTADMQRICAEQGISLCGGHTEITESVRRPLLVGTMAGTARARDLIDKRSMRPGDRVFLTKGAGVEGTGLLARECELSLLAGGMTREEVAACAAFLDRIGVVQEAAVARSFPGVTALHDVTEGGVATALRELGAAGGHRLRLHLDRIPVYPETRRVCEVLGIDPLGLIGSGSLLITCEPGDAAALVRAVLAVGVHINEIGEVLDEGEGVEALLHGIPADLPWFDRDELSRLGRDTGPSAYSPRPTALGKEPSAG